MDSTEGCAWKRAVENLKRKRRMERVDGKSKRFSS
jgi:hypothetical protein